MFEMKFSTDNAAFRGADGERDVYAEEEEVVRILLAVARRINDDGYHAGAVVDINGNGVGRWVLK